MNLQGFLEASAHTAIEIDLSPDMRANLNGISKGGLVVFAAGAQEDNHLVLRVDSIEPHRLTASAAAYLGARHPELATYEPRTGQRRITSLPSGGVYTNDAACALLESQNGTRPYAGHLRSTLPTR